MSTTASIIVEGLSGVYLYKHWDGDPDSTRPWLEFFNADFSKQRGDDPQYKFAQLIRSSSSMQKEFNLDKSKHTGWGVVVDTLDPGCDYNYTLKKDGSVSL